jgi:hypothetical protein
VCTHGKQEETRNTHLLTYTYTQVALRMEPVVSWMFAAVCSKHEQRLASADRLNNSVLWGNDAEGRLALLKEHHQADTEIELSIGTTNKRLDATNTFKKYTTQC